MREREFYLPSSDGNSRLHCMEWLPDGEILGAIQIVHGMMEHTGRYRETAEWLADRGIAVYGHDHLGHGRTAAEKEDLGYFGDRDGEFSLVKDVRRLTLYGKRRYRGKRLFLLGHSMGSFMVRRTLTVYEDGPDGVILMGTGSQPEGMVLAGWCLASLVSAVRGRRSRSRLLHELSLGNYNRKFWPVQTDHDWLTRDMEKARSFEADPYCQFLFTAGAYRDFFRVILMDQRAERLGRMRTDMPLLLLSGDRDPVGENERGVRKVYKRFSDAGCRDITLGFYKDARHELFNETNREEVREDLFSWLLGHLEEQDG